MRIFFLRFAFCLLALGQSAHGSQQQPVLVAQKTQISNPVPRLYFFERNKQRGFILGESHAYLPDELDSYYHNVIVKASERAGVFVSENVIPSLAGVVLASDCANVAPDLRAETNRALNSFLLRNNGNQLIGAYAASRPEEAKGKVPSLAEYIEFLPFFVRLQELHVQWLLNGSPQRHPSLPTLEPGITLKEKMLSRRDVKEYFVESDGDFIRGFCSLTLAQQSAYVSGLIDFLSALRAYDYGDENDQACFRKDVQTAYDQQRAGLRAGKAFLNTLPCPLTVDIPSTMMPFVFGARNRVWVKNIETFDRSATPMIVVGSAHLIDTQYGKSVLTLLRERGYKVTPVYRPTDIDRLLRRVR